MCVQPGNVALAEHDPELFELIGKEADRQRRSLELIASEVCCVLCAVCVCEAP